MLSEYIDIIVQIKLSTRDKLQIENLSMYEIMQLNELAIKVIHPSRRSERSTRNPQNQLHMYTSGSYLLHGHCMYKGHSTIIHN